MKFRFSSGTAGFTVGAVVFWILPLFKWGVILLTRIGDAWNMLLWPISGGFIFWAAAIGNSLILGVLVVGLLAIFPETVRKRIAGDIKRPFWHRTLLVSVGIFVALLLRLGYGLWNTLLFFA